MQQKDLFISVITVVYNGEKTISSCIDSVASQTYNAHEHLIIDGSSKDNTIKILESYSNTIKYISEPDKGLYDAMNKGIGMAKGDVIAILNADDIFASNNVLEVIAKEFVDEQIEGVSSAVAIYKDSYGSKPLRLYKSISFKTSQFKYGLQPPHPGVFFRKSVYDRYGKFDLDFKITADFELLLRFIAINKVTMRYIPFQSVKMLSGGLSSSLKNKIMMEKEMLKALEKHGIQSNWLLIKFKYFLKLSQFIGN